MEPHNSLELDAVVDSTIWSIISECVVTIITRNFFTMGRWFVFLSICCTVALASQSNENESPAVPVASLFRLGLK